MFFKTKRDAAFTGDGLILFNSAEEAISGQRVLMGASYETRLVAPPPSLRKGCDLALEINILQRTSIEQLLKEHDVYYLDLVPLIRISQTAVSPTSG